MEVKHKVNIVDEIRKTTKLNKNGIYYVGHCPFHPDISESLIVDEEKQLYFCLECGLGGDVLC